MLRAQVLIFTLHVEYVHEQQTTKDYIATAGIEDAISSYTNSTVSDKPFFILGHGVPAKARPKLNTYLHRTYINVHNMQNL